MGVAVYSMAAQTFFGRETADLDMGKFLRLMWRERVRMEQFLSGSQSGDASNSRSAGCHLI